MGVPVWRSRRRRERCHYRVIKTDLAQTCSSARRAKVGEELDVDPVVILQIRRKVVLKEDRLMILGDD